MATDCISQVTFEFHDKLKPVVARFDQAQASTDGGAVLLTALDGRLQLTDRLAGCLADHRDPDKILHPLRDLLRQRIFGLGLWLRGCERCRPAGERSVAQTGGRARSRDWRGPRLAADVVAV